RIRLGHGLVRSVRGKADDVQGTGRTRRALDRERRGRALRDAPRGRGGRFRDAPARALRRRPFPRGPRVHGNARPREFPGPLCAAPSLARHGELPGGGEVSRVIAGTLPSGGGEPLRAHRLGREGHRRADGSGGAADEGALIFTTRLLAPALVAAKASSMKVVRSILFAAATLALLLPLTCAPAHAQLRGHGGPLRPGAGAPARQT